MLKEIPEVGQRYLAMSSELFDTAPPEAESDLPVQLAKLAVGLLTDRYAGAAVGGEGAGVRPFAFKSLVGKNHPEFSSARQQDVRDYFEHLLEHLGRAEAQAAGRGSAAALAAAAGVSARPASSLFAFETESRVQCVESGAVAYKSDLNNVMGLNIPLEAATNFAEVSGYKEREQKRQKLRQV